MAEKTIVLNKERKGSVTLWQEKMRHMKELWRV